MASDREALRGAIARVTFALNNAELRGFDMTHVRTHELRLVLEALAAHPSAQDESTLCSVRGHPKWSHVAPGVCAERLPDQSFCCCEEFTAASPLPSPAGAPRT